MKLLPILHYTKNTSDLLYFHNWLWNTFDVWFVVTKVLLLCLQVTMPTKAARARWDFRGSATEEPALCSSRTGGCVYRWDQVSTLVSQLFVNIFLTISTKLHISVVSMCGIYLVFTVHSCCLDEHQWHRALSIFF